MRRRFFSWLNVGVLPSREQQDAAVERVLKSCCERDALRLPLPEVATGFGRSIEEARGTEDPEALLSASALHGGTSGEPDDLVPLSREAVLEAFLCTAVEVHPFANASQDAKLAMRWVATSFVNLHGSDGEQAAAAVADLGANVFAASASASSSSSSTPFRERACPTSADEAMRIYGGTVARLINALSLHDLEQSGVSRQAAHALLRGLYALHVRPSERMNGRAEDRAMYDSVLLGTMSALNIMTRVAGCIVPSSRCARVQRRVSTLIAVMGSIGFAGARRLSRMVRPANESRNAGNATVNATANALGADDEVPFLTACGLDPLVQCPLCRTSVATDRAILNVHAGDAAPVCCVCTDAPSDVCLPCGHLCMCTGCYQELPRFS